MLPSRVRGAQEAALPPEPPDGKLIPVLKVFMPAAVIDPVREVLSSGYIAEGPRAEAFEERLGAWLGVPRVLALNSGTSALRLALRLAGVGPGDEVISSPMTCIAGNAQILLAGASIRWADIDPASGNIDPADIEEKITPRTRAILFVDWGGYPADLDTIRAIADARGLRVIEDACHAFGSIYKGRPLGAHSDFVCFSFQAVKMMTTGDGGALVCRRAEDAERGRLLRWYGMDRRLDHHMQRQRSFFEQDVAEAGDKIHMNDLAAAIGLEQLKHVDGNIALHRAHAARFDEAFARLQCLRPTTSRSPDRHGNHWLYTLRVPDPSDFIGAMKRSGIGASPVHVRNDRYSLFKGFEAPLPGVAQFDAEHVCIPVGWWLGEPEMEQIIERVTRYDAECGAAAAARTLAEV